MRTCTLLLALAAAVRAEPALPEIVKLKQADPRPHPKFTFAEKRGLGPALPGLAQGAIP